MSQDIYFIQVEDADAHELQQVATSLTGFMDDPNATTVLVSDKVKPLDRDEAIEYLESMADACGMKLEKK